MSISAHWYTLALQSQFNGSPVNWTSDTINVGLVTSSYTPAQDTDAFWGTATTGPQNFETTGTGYSANGVTLGTVSVGGVTGSHEIPLKAANSVWTTASFTCRYAVIYKHNAGESKTWPLLGYVDFGSNETVSTGTFTIQWDATNGVLALSAS